MAVSSVASRVPTSRARPRASRTAASTPISHIGEFDFANYSYPFDGRQIQLSDDGETDSTILNIDYGDVNKDGIDEAAVLVTFNFGGSSSYTRCFVYTLEKGRPKLLGIIKGDESTHSGLADAKIDSERGRITIERYPHDEDAPHCCPAIIETVEMSWNGKGFVQVGTVSSKKIISPNK
jgi:hypothetical protein